MRKKYLINPKEGKIEEKKMGQVNTQKRWQAIHPNISIITINRNGLNAPWRQITKSLLMIFFLNAKLGYRKTLAFFFKGT